MNAQIKDIYRGIDPHDIPLYGVAEAARYIGVSDVTLYNWLSPVRSKLDGNPAPLIKTPRGSTRLSFWNLVEAYVTKTLRTTHRVPLAELREAVHYAEKRLQVKRLLVNELMMTGGHQVFITEIDRLINLGRGGQLAMREMLRSSLQQVRYEDNLAIKFFPVVRREQEEDLISISPTIAFGKPVVVSKAISTRAIAERYESGEETDFIAEDYGITSREVEEAIIYEAAA